MEQEDSRLAADSSPKDGQGNPTKRVVKRRSFLKGVGVTGAALSASGFLGSLALGAEESGGSLDRGDAAILRFLDAIEQIESDLWQQYAELGGTLKNEPPLLKGLTVGNTAYTKALSNLDSDMAQYINDNTEDEFSHAAFLSAYLKSKGAAAADLSGFHTLP
ncbi:MAG TPA: twin-arginine translocation signal domain-containing protein, partial [Acidobacteriaceae bacterium]